MKRPVVAFIALLACFAAVPAFSLDLDRAEIESAKDAAIVFVNYEGPQSRIDSLADIKGIGSSLGSAIGRGAKSAGDGTRYRVVRIVDPSVAEGFDADILYLGPGAQVDHIRNLRWIIASYLVEAWRYSEKDAYTVATFITVYDAVHRGDMQYFGSKYKKAVVSTLDAGTVGLSTRYTEWAGKSAIVVPLSSGAKPGSLGAVDTGAVAGKDVTASLRGEPDKGIPERQAMTDIKEREAAQLKSDAEKQKAEISRSEADLAAEKAKVEADRAKLEADKKAADEKAAAEKEAAAKGGAPAAQTAPEAGGKAPEAQAAEIQKREAEQTKAEESVAAKETEIAAKKEEAAKTEAAASAKEAEAAEDRKDITQDQKEVIASEVAAKGRSEAAGVFLLQVVDSSYPFARVVFIDSEKGNLIRASRLNSIRGRSVVDSGDSFVAVAGKEGGTGAIRLVRLDKASLEVVAQGSVDIYPESQVWKFGESFYAVIKGDGGAYYLGRFDAELKEAARSTEAVNPFTFLSEASGGLAAQTPSGGFAVLAKQGLERIKELKP